MTIHIEKGTDADYEDVKLCAREAYLQYVEAIGREPAPMCADFASLIARGVVDVARFDGTFAGYVVLYTENVNNTDKSLFVENIAVRPVMCGNGIGSQLMMHAESVARENQLCKIRLYTNEKMLGNLRWYPRLGFVETARVEEDGFSRVYFEKNLV